jgi:hypothetical protein
MELFKIFKREKPQQVVPQPNFEDNWRQEHYEQNLKSGVAALQKGKQVVMYDDGRGYELACDIKRRFILEYTKQLAEKIEIKGGAGKFTVKINAL